jgi:hypothetical protein
MLDAPVPVCPRTPAAVVVAIGMVKADVPVIPEGAVHQKN